ncbi:MAG TPA: IS110 family transposase [Candidatus Limnocylindrales bacterium]|nr:IS110 family transposase [Candidatus Limnocylindrales bacterium]HEV8696638.1 IS110 family transposase [Candidatus Limnocylindrales bacterium]
MQVTRGMRRQSMKLARRRARLPIDALIAGVDLAKKESVVVFSRAADRGRLGRLTIPTDRTGVERLVARAAELRERHGLGELVVAMEPTSHFWKIVARGLDAVGVRYVLVQSFVVAMSRELDNLTRDKTDARDAGLIADLAVELRFTDTQLPEGPWAELDLLAEARDGRVVERGAALQEQRALLELVWPELLRACPALTGTHLQALLRTGLTPQQVAAMSEARLLVLLRRHHPRRFLRWMGRRLRAAASRTEATPETGGAALRWRLAADRVDLAETAIADLDARMAELLEATGYGRLRGQIRGLGDVALTNLLALSGDPARFDDGRCLVKLAGSNPTERSSGERQASGGIHRRGRPTLRVVAYQAAISLVRHNPDFRARYLELTADDRPRRLAKKQAYVALANKLLRTLWALAIRGAPYRSEIARGEVRPQPIAA